MSPESEASARPLKRRTLLSLAALAGTLPMSVQPSAAATYPAKPVKLVVSYPPGGTADMLGRIIADGLAKKLGQPFVIDNRPGANGNIGADAAARSANDGYTLLLTAPGPLAVNESLFTSLPFNPKTAFAPITRICTAPLVLVVPSALPIHNVSELLAYAKAHPKATSYASQGIASSGHLAMELLKTSTGLQAVHVPYKGAAPALADLVGGQVTMMFDNISSSLPHVKTGALRAIAVAEPKRLKVLPGLPTVAESGVPGFEATPWFGLVAPAGTPKAIVEALYADINEILRAPGVASKLEQMGVEVASDRPEEFARIIASERVKWQEVVKRSGAKAE
ncbi:Bug family tripartite tricarboxylate transporter substrate binding protein [Ottowia sp. VDI28]|uniref:Bug family tripartite tricarboxylate transporter substrate binding protein n=1 Tax=Ottowia sp. VDI28 TaxID=3133968 RepID=UPI003C30E5CB